METLDGVVPVSNYLSEFLLQHSEKARSINNWNTNTKNTDLLQVSYESSVITDIDNILQDQYVEIYSSMLWALLELDVDADGIAKILSTATDENLTSLYFGFLLTEFPDGSLYFNREQIPTEIIDAFGNGITTIIVKNITLIDPPTLNQFTKLHRWTNLLGLYGLDERTLQNLEIEDIQTFSQYVCDSIDEKEMFIQQIGIYATKIINPKFYKYSDMIKITPSKLDYSSGHVSITVIGRTIELNTNDEIDVMVLESRPGGRLQEIITGGHYTKDGYYTLVPNMVYKLTAKPKYILII